MDSNTYRIGNLEKKAEECQASRERVSAGLGEVQQEVREIKGKIDTVIDLLVAESRNRRKE